MNLLILVVDSAGVRNTTDNNNGREIVRRHAIRTSEKSITVCNALVHSTREGDEILCLLVPETQGRYHKNSALRIFIVPKCPRLSKEASNAAAPSIAQMHTMVPRIHETYTSGINIERTRYTLFSRFVPLPSLVIDKKNVSQIWCAGGQKRAYRNQRLVSKPTCPLYGQPQLP